MLILRRLALLGAVVAGLGIAGAQALPVAKPAPAADAIAAADGGLVQKTTYGYRYPRWHYGPKWGGYRSYDYVYPRYRYSYRVYPSYRYTYGHYPRFRAHFGYVRPHRAYRYW